MELDEAVLENISKNYMEYISDLQKLVKQPSVSASGEGIEECASILKEIMESRGIRSRLLRIKGANPVVYGEVLARGAEKTLLFYNHYDVQPPDPVDLWNFPPYSAMISDGRVYGRGAADDKGEIASRLAVVDSFLRSGKDPPCNFKFLVEGEEESGSVHLPEYARTFKELFSADAGLWEFGGVDTLGRPVVRLGMKGILYVELVARGPARDLHSSLAAVVDNPAWRLVNALGTLRSDDGSILIDGWIDSVRSLLDYERKLLEDFPYDEEGALKNYGVKSFINGLTGLPLRKRLQTEPTCNICGIWSGYTGPGSKTVLPAEARAKLDFRLVPDQDPQELFGLLRKHLDSKGYADIQISSMEGEPAARVSPEQPIARSSRSAARKVYGKEALVELSSPVTGPLYVFTRDLQIPFAAIGTGHPEDAQHSPNESKRLDTFVSGTKWVAQTVYNFSTGRYDG
jgi:acetylornithine deacetylase/succinyl-diaminopimelate desuccinylase-like protein